MILVAVGVTMFGYGILFILGLSQIILSILGFTKLKSYKNYSKVEYQIRKLIYSVSLLVGISLDLTVLYVIIQFLINIATTM